MRLEDENIWQHTFSKSLIPLLRVAARTPYLRSIPFQQRRSVCQLLDFPCGTYATKKRAVMNKENAPDDCTSIHFDPDWEVGLGGGLWSTGKAMSTFFQDHSPQIHSDLTRLMAKKQGDSKLSVIELGSGNGYLSCIFAKCFSSIIQVRMQMKILLL
jgi:hypothetical protein